MSLSLHRRALVLALAGALLAPAPAFADEVSGVLEVAVVDRFAEDRSEERVVLRTAGDDLRVPDAGDDLVALAGHRVVLSGDREGATLEDAALVDDQGTTAAAQDAETPGAKRVLVMPVHVRGEAPPEWDIAKIRQLLFGDGATVDEYYRALSFDRVSLTGDIRPWHAVEGGTFTKCDYDRIADSALRQARDARVAVDTYAHHLVVFPRTSACRWAGLAQVGGKPAWVNGYPTLRVVAHEVGHNLGLHHAGSLDCKDADGAPTALSGQCTAVEYGDEFSTMGGSSTHLLSNYHRTQLGLYAPGQQVDVAADGVYDLATTTHATPGVKLLRVRRPETGQAFVLELREPFDPWDAFPLQPDGGVLVRLAPPGSERPHTQIVDTQPGTADGQRDAPLDPGESFTDPASGTVIAVTAITGGVARVRVGFPPTRPSDVRAAGHEGALDLAWEPSADDTAVARYEVERDGAPIGGGEAAALRDAAAPAGTHTYRVTAVDAAGNRGPGESLVVDVPPAPAPVAVAPTAQLALPAPRDLVPPTVGLLSPRLGRRPVALPRDRVLRLRIAGATRVEARYDGRLLRRTGASQLAVRLPRAARRGTHRVEIRAVDAAGNVQVLRLRLRAGRLARA